MLQHHYKNYNALKLSPEEKPQFHTTRTNRENFKNQKTLNFLCTCKEAYPNQLENRRNSLSNWEHVDLYYSDLKCGETPKYFELLY